LPVSAQERKSSIGKQVAECSGRIKRYVGYELAKGGEQFVMGDRSRIAGVPAGNDLRLQAVAGKGGIGTAIHFALGECSLGSILVASSKKGVCAILMGDDPGQLARDLQDRFPQAELIGGDAGFEALIAKLVGFVEAPAIGLDLPLDVRGTVF
jgi:hypothetical protein